jgi:ABC-type bacteriocin/lantibiotic exporter with double-glycine peptidase domain
MQTGYYWNCGLNVAYIAIRLFHKEVDIYQLADEIKAGTHLERDVSLLDLKRVFEKYGLAAEGFRADYAEELISFAKPDIILIVRIDSHRRDQDVGHFIVIKGGQDYVIVIDPPCHPKRFAKEDIIEDDVLSTASGEFLAVYEPEVPSHYANEKGGSCRK